MFSIYKHTYKQPIKFILNEVLLLTEVVTRKIYKKYIFVDSLRLIITIFRSMSLVAPCPGLRKSDSLCMAWGRWAGASHSS